MIANNLAWGYNSAVPTSGGAEKAAAELRWRLLSPRSRQSTDKDPRKALVPQVWRGAKARRGTDSAAPRVVVAVVVVTVAAVVMGNAAVTDAETEWHL